MRAPHRYRALFLKLAIIASLAAIAVRPDILVPLLRFCQPGAVWSIPNEGNRIALTFDDGPDPTYTPQVLAILARAGVPATFFLIGGQAQRFPGIVADIRAAGHEIGNHTWSWRATYFMEPGEFLQDLLRTQQLLQMRPGWFRPASGWVRAGQIRAAESLGYKCVLGSSFAFDQFQPPPRLISLLIGRTLRSGVVIVLHDGGGRSRANTVAALPSIIHDARRRGLQFSRLSDMASKSADGSGRPHRCSWVHANLPAASASGRCRQGQCDFVPAVPD